MRASWVVVVGGVCACGAPASEVGTTRQAVTQETPLVGAELGTDPPVLQPTDLGHSPAVATDGNGFLAVQEVGSRIRAVRVGPSGAVLDSRWLDLGESTADQYYPSVAFGGGHYLVTWSAFLHDGDSTIEGRFVKPNGEVEGSESFTLATSGLYPSVGWNGARFLLSYLHLGEPGEGGNVAITSFEVNGAAVPSSTHALSAPGSIAYPRLAVGPTASLVAWEAYVHDDVFGDIGTIRGARVDGSGAPDPAGELELSDGEQGAGSVSVAAGDDEFLAVWNTTAGPSAVRGSVVGADGEVTSQGIAISHSDQDSGLASVAFDGDSYLVAWADGRDEQSVYGNRVSASGLVASTTDVKLANGSPRYVSNGSDRTALAWSGSHFLLSFLGNGIEGSLIAPDLQLENGQIALTGVSNKQGYPRSVWDGENYLVLWTDERTSDTDMEVRGVRIGSNGQLLDPDGISFSDAESPAFSAQLASTGQGSSLVVWFGVGGDSFTRTIDSEGVLGVRRAFSADPLNSPPGLASNGSGYFASYATGDSSDGVVLGRLLDVNGVGGAPFDLDASTVNTTPSVFGLGSDYLVSYSNSGMWLMPVKDNGVAGPSVALSPSPGYVTAASTGEGRALVVWSEVNETQIHARFYEEGAFTGAPWELAETSAGYGAAVAWDGTNYWAVWETPEHLLQGRAVGADGSLGPSALWVNEECFAPVLSSDGDGQLLLSYSKYGEQSRTRRVFSRLVGRDAVSPEAGAGNTAGTGMGGASGGSSTSGGTSSGGTSSGGTSSGGTSSGGTSSGGTSSGGTSSGGTSSGGTSSVGGSSTSAGTSGGGSAPPPVPFPLCSLHAVGAGSASTGFFSLSFAVFGAALLRRRRQPAA